MFARFCRLFICKAFNFYSPNETNRLLYHLWGNYILEAEQEFTAGWSSPVARWAHNPKVSGSNPDPATNNKKGQGFLGLFC